MPRVSFLLLLLLGSNCLHADDWPQWMGPGRDGVWHEDGIIEQIPSDGLTVKWRVPIHGGYSGPAVADGRVYVTDYVRQSGTVANNPGTRDKLTGSERIVCLDAASGELVWKHEYDCPYAVSYGCGPRCTPAVDLQAGVVYSLGAEGHLVALRTADGSVLWKKDLKSEYNTETPLWGFSGHPLIDGNKLICLVGGEGSVVVAFNKSTGQELWKAVSASEPGYCPPSIIEAGGTRQLLLWDPEKINSLNPETGEEYWTVPLKPGYAMSIMAPQKYGDYLFASGIGEAGKLLKLGVSRPAAEVVWESNAQSGVYCANSTPLIRDGIIYGVGCRKGRLQAVDLETGDRLWETYEPTTGGRRLAHGTAFLVRNGDHWFLFSETGDLIHAKLTKQGYEELGRFHVLEPTGGAFGRDVVWAHPAFANRCLFARNDKEIVCVSLAQQ